MGCIIGISKALYRCMLLLLSVQWRFKSYPLTYSSCCNKLYWLSVGKYVQYKSTPMVFPLFFKYSQCSLGGIQLWFETCRKRGVLNKMKVDLKMKFELGIIFHFFLRDNNPQVYLYWHSLYMYKVYQQNDTFIKFF